MPTPSPASILTYFRDLPDPRHQTKNKKHRLLDLLSRPVPASSCRSFERARAAAASATAISAARPGRPAGRTGSARTGRCTRR